MLYIFSIYLVSFIIVKTAGLIFGAPVMQSDIERIVIFKMDSIMYGVLISFLVIYKSNFVEKLRGMLLAVSMVACLLLFIIYYIFIDNPASIGLNGLEQPLSKIVNILVLPLGPVFLSLMLPFFAALTNGDSPNQLRKLFETFVKHVSKISYSIYLINWPLSEFVFKPMIPNSPMLSILNFVFYYVALIIVATLLYKYFELPMMRLRDKL